MSTKKKHAKVKREEKRDTEKREEKELKDVLGNWYDDTIMDLGSLSQPRIPTKCDERYMDME